MAVKISFEGKAYSSDGTESVLDTLLNNKVSVPYSCKSGVCHCCMMKLASGEVEGDAYKGLTEAQIKAGFFLPCSCTASSDLTIGLVDDHSLAKKTKAEIIDKTDLSGEIMRLRIKPEVEYRYQSGQFLNLFKDENTVRSYSLASTSKLEDFLEFHIQRLPNGAVSGWLHDAVNIGDSVHISEAMGECYYRPGKEDRPLLLVATGSGFAPVYGIVRTALEFGHYGPIHVYHGSSRQDGLYLVDEMREMAEHHPNLHYTPCLSRDAVGDVAKGRANDIAMANHPDLKGWLVYLCGHPDMVNNLRKQAFLAGSSFSDIYADAFTHS